MCTGRQDIPAAGELRGGSPPVARESGARLRVLDAVLRTVTLYAFAGWLYIVLNAAIHPGTLTKPLTHFSSWPHEDTFGAASFGFSFAAALSSGILRAAR